MTIAHEIGHAYMQEPFQGNPGCGVFHAPALYTDLECAFQEGFAEYFMLVTRPDAATANPFDDRLSAYEDNIYLLQSSNPDGSDPNDPNGTIIEGAVASFLLDLTDSSNETGDSTAYPGTYLADIFDTCTHDSGQAPTGIDHIIYCLEKQIDTSMSSYFYARGSQPASYSEAATEPGSWSFSSIRALWLRDLFDQ